MTEANRRLRAADPASALPPQPDARAEADLRVLLAEPRAAAAPSSTRDTARRRRGPILVTAMVALVVVAVTAAVLGAVHPRTDQAAPPPSPTAAAPTISPPYVFGDCKPAEVLPFECGTYRSVYGADAVTGDTGGPAKDHLSISFTTQNGVLLLRAQTDSCFAGVLPLRYDGKALVDAGEPLFGQAAGCSGPGTDDRKNWAYAFLTGPLEVQAGGGLSFNGAKSPVTFEYQGSADMGAPQLPRNDATCVPAHVEPFSCDTYFSTGGTGATAFLGTNLFRLRFQHSNGELTAAFVGRCNALSVVLQPDGNTVVSIGAGATAMACGGAPGDQDGAVMDFFSGVLTYRIDGDRLTFTSGSSTATFSRDIGACRPSRATSPFCGSSTATSGSGSLAFLGSGPDRIAFGESGERLTATVQGSCGTTTYAVTVGWSALRLRRLSTTTAPCPIGADTHDTALSKFLTSPLVYRTDVDTLTLESAASGPSSSAVFTRTR